MGGHGKHEQPERLAEKLLKIRAKLRLSQVGMANALERQGVKIYPGYVARYELGDRIPGLLTMRAYAKVAGVSMDQITDDELDLPAKYK
jgi:transcriptional regulator with XRE-family HTH domain